MPSHHLLTNERHGAPFEKSQCTKKNKITAFEWAQVDKTFPCRSSIGNRQLKMHQYGCSRVLMGSPFQKPWLQQAMYLC